MSIQPLTAQRVNIWTNRTVCVTVVNSTDPLNNVTALVCGTISPPADPNDLTQSILTPNEQTVVNFLAYIMLQGFFLGTSSMFLWRAIRLFLEKRNLLTLADCVQLSFWIARNVIILVFGLAPSSYVDCTWRQYASGFASSAVIVTVWWLQFIKFQAMYKDRPVVIYTVLGICVVCVAACFPFLRATISIDTLNHCAIRFDTNMQIAYISTDVFVNVMLSALFGLAIWKHVSNTDANWSSYNKMTYILTCDVRGAFVDAAAQLVKLSLNLSGLPSSQTLFGAHVCDWVKVASAHWFVNDVVGSQKNDCCSHCSRTEGNASSKAYGTHGSQHHNSNNGQLRRARTASQAPSGKGMMSLSDGSGRPNKVQDLEGGTSAGTVLKSNQTLNE
ncbi:hypothetical protein HDU96_008765 [Phlyctochytrium bullatum]|nr:hypothetical protein HDU96_008765 [Phlyctochytrium bullatum]